MPEPSQKSGRWWARMPKRASGEYDDPDYRWRLAFLYMVLITVMFFVGVFCWSAFAAGNMAVAAADLAAIACAAGVLFYLRCTGDSRGTSYVFVGFIAPFLLYLLASGGVGDTGYVWAYTFPPAALFLLGGKRGSVTAVVFTAAAAACVFFDWPFVKISMSDALRFRFAGSLSIVVIISYFFESARAASQAEVEARNKDLSQLTSRLQASNRDLARFLEIGSHHLQEPVRNVVSYLQLLRKRYGGKLDSDADEYIDYAVDGGLWMKHLIGDLLEYTHTGSGEWACEAVDTEEALGVAKGNLRGLLQRTGGAVTHDSLPTVMADRRQTVRLFQDLVGNALKFRGPHPPHVHISARKGVAKDGEDNSGTMARFTVRDNGIGIDPEHHERIFDMFVKLHPRSAYNGTGTGLAICRRIVELHGGQIGVESVPGEGSSFHFTLPTPRQGDSHRERSRG